MARAASAGGTVLKRPGGLPGANGGTTVGGNDPQNHETFSISPVYGAIGCWKSGLPGRHQRQAHRRETKPRGCGRPNTSMIHAMRPVGVEGYPKGLGPGGWIHRALLQAAAAVIRGPVLFEPDEPCMGHTHTARESADVNAGGNLITRSGSTIPREMHLAGSNGAAMEPLQ